MATKPVTAIDQKKTEQDEGPQNWEKLSTRVDGFWIPDKGSITGTVIGARRFINSEQRRTLYYMIQLSKPCTAAVILENGERQELTANPGEIIAVFDSAQLKVLRNRLGSTVWIKYLGKRKLKGSKTLKEFDCKVKPGEKAAEVPIEEATREDNLDASNPDF